jgi:hypothetical protein
MGLLSLRYGQRAEAFTGRLRSATSSCENGRTVKLFKERGSNDRLVGRDVTRSGSYRLEKRRANGRYYTRSVAERRCNSERSGTIRLQ